MKNFDLLLLNVSTPEPDKVNKWINSATSDRKTGEVDYGIVGEWLDQGLKWIGDKILDVMATLTIGCKVIIVASFLIYFCSGERKSLATAIKWSIIFTLLCLIRGALG